MTHDQASESAAFQTAKPATKVFLCPVSQKSLYVQLTHGELNDRYRLVYREEGGLAEAIALLEAGEPALVHVQWEEFFFRKLKTSEQVATTAARVEAQLERIAALGGPILWTIHNQLPHQGDFIAEFLSLRARLALLASRIIVHNAASIRLLGEQIGLASTDPRLTVIPHPSYAGMYEPEGAADRLVRSAEPPSTKPFVLGFGTMRKQKGFDFMLSALDAQFMLRHGLRLRLSGRGDEGARLHAVHGERPDVDWDLAYTPHEGVPGLFRSAACLVLPYRRVATSGVAMLALTLGAIVVAPRLPTFVELLAGDLRRFLYDPGDDKNLRAVVRDVAALTTEEARAVRLAGIAIADQVHPRRISAALGKVYDDVSAPRASRDAGLVTPACRKPPAAAAPPVAANQAPPATPADVFFWRHDKPLGNFGDALTLILLARLFQGACHYPDHTIHLIGSVITPGRIDAALKEAPEPDRNSRRVLFWGCGKKDGQPLAEDAYRRCTFLGVRGTLTRDALRLPRETPLGDPGLLLPRVYRPRNDPAMSGKILWVPHVHHDDPLEEDLEGHSAHNVLRPAIPNTVEACERFIDAIASARFVMANAMHAAVVALAYGTPFAFWSGSGINVPFKWRDLTSALGMELSFHRTFAGGSAAFDRTRPDRALAALDLTPLLRAAPYDLHPLSQ